MPAARLNCTKNTPDVRRGNSGDWSGTKRRTGKGEEPFELVQSPQGLGLAPLLVQEPVSNSIESVGLGVGLAECSGLFLLAWI
ncbi:MAG TPA: hypothetical protein VEK34_15905 [Methylocella sp.]|nr:hypothetical protein [Methylocella sp.]